MYEISIGLPILNGEKFVRKRLENILSQTFSNFELIISNNASTDSTLLICEEYAKKDSRIKIFNQKKTVSAEKNFEFVVLEAKSKYFVFAPVDDLWDESFLEMNFKFLEKNPNYINSSGKVIRYGEEEINLQISSEDSFLKKTYKKIRSQFRPFYNLSFTGTYEEKASKCFRHNNMLFLFGLFRTDVIKKIIVNLSMHSSDLIMCLRALEYGDVNIINDVKIYFYVKGFSSQGILKKLKYGINSPLEAFFPFLPLTIWCKNHFGWKFIMKNLRHVIWLNTVYGITPLLLDVFKTMKKDRHNYVH